MSTATPTGLWGPDGIQETQRCHIRSSWPSTSSTACSCSARVLQSDGIVPAASIRGGRSIQQAYPQQGEQPAGRSARKECAGQQTLRRERRPNGRGRGGATTCPRHMHGDGRAGPNNVYTERDSDPFCPRKRMRAGEDARDEVPFPPKDAEASKGLPPSSSAEEGRVATVGLLRVGQLVTGLLGGGDVQGDGFGRREEGSGGGVVLWDVR